MQKDDVIYRQVAIDALDCINGTEEVLRSLPSAQSEIVFCKDCKHRGENPIADGRYWCELHDTFMYYCLDAERRTDEYID